ncbi:MAG: bL34 family ribosomal protein [Candidatus Peregrinibacteria bacterium]
MLGKLKWRRRMRKHGFLKRKLKPTGRRVLASRRRKGRARIVVQRKGKK